MFSKMGAMAALAPSLFGQGSVRFDPTLARLRRHVLGGGAWFDHLPGWLSGHEVVFHAVREEVSWESGRRWMYEREVDVPRLTAGLSFERAPHPVLLEARRALELAYDTTFDRLHAALYRDGRDSVAWHGDRVQARPQGNLVAILSLGEPRRFLLKSRAGGRSLTLTLGWGDLIVLGGTAQQTWRHCVPKCASAGPRMSLMFRRSEDGVGVSDPNTCTRV